MDVKNLTASCGLPCFACALYKDNITDEVVNQTATGLGMDVKNVSCEGCRSEQGCSISSVMCSMVGETECLTKKCVTDKGLHNCSECEEFPCDYLRPVFDMASLPHNTKIFNLSRIKAVGLEEWAKEAGSIQQSYFKGKFAYGKGSIVEKE